MNTVRAVVEKIVCDGVYGPYAVAIVEGIEGSSVTFALSDSVWLERDWPEPGSIVCLSDLRQKRQGWRAMFGRFVRPSDRQYLALSTERNEIMTKTYSIAKGKLHFAMAGNGEFMCQELLDIPTVFAQQWATEQVAEAIESLITLCRDNCIISSKGEEDAKRPKRDRKAEGIAIFDEVVPQIKKCVASANCTPFEELLFWLDGHWYYYNSELRGKMRIDQEKLFGKTQALAKAFLTPVLPEQVRKELGDDKLLSVVASHGHFAILFENYNHDIRYIVTDSQLFEIHDVSGYSYLDITPNGKPIIRCCTDRGGNRAFFDGVHLMSHERFKTCAPKTVMIDGGYKVNSTKCTIINGKMFPLIDVDDKVAHTTGMDSFDRLFCMGQFNVKDAVASYEKSEQSAKQLRVEGDKVYQNGHELKPIGVFQPSHMRLQASGFALVEWSDFYEIPNYHYQHILVIDDKQEWINQVQDTFTSHVGTINTLRTTDKREALARVREVNPAALLLDVHLTDEEEFDGLWIANQLHASNFKGMIMLTSSYGRDKLRAMAELIKGRVRVPGKDLERVRQCLLDRDD